MALDSIGKTVCRWLGEFAAERLCASEDRRDCMETEMMESLVCRIDRVLCDGDAEAKSIFWTAYHQKIESLGGIKETLRPEDDQSDAFSV